MVESPLDLTAMLNTLIFLVFMLLLFTGLNQKFQTMIWVRNIRNKMALIKRLHTEAYDKTVELLKKLGYKGDPSKLVESLSEFFIIEPVAAEPTGLMRRLEHLLLRREARFKSVLKEAVPEASDAERSIAEVAVEVTAVLNLIYKIVRHILILGEKTNNWILIMQLELEMPNIVRLARTYRRALDSFLDGTPIGDGLGPLVVANILRSVGVENVEREEIVEDTVAIRVEKDGRTIYLVKAEGPSATVGRPGEAVRRLVERMKGRISRIIMIDAALKLEGEDTGSIAEGVGAAIGDPGPEKFKIETVATDYNIPLDSIIVKESLEEAITTMKKEIAESAEKVARKIIKTIEEKTEPGDVVLVVGVGNTVGIAQ